MWRALQAKKADDYILATGHACSVREFAIAAFAELGVELVFKGRGKMETARRADTGDIVLRVDSKFYRPVESITLVGDATRAKKFLGWKAGTVGMDVARMMARADFATLTA
jgi:GDPmannose 4,6-dehydratase